MQIKRPNRLVTGLVTILSTLPYSGCNTSTIPKEPKNQPTLEKLDNLESENEGLKAQVEKYKLKFEKLYKNVGIDRTYAVKSIEELLNERRIVYDEKMLEASWSKLGINEREMIYLVEVDHELYYQCMNDEKQKRYNEFLRKGLKPKVESQISRILGFEDNDTSYGSSRSLITFEIINSLPPMR